MDFNKALESVCSVLLLSSRQEKFSNESTSEITISNFTHTIFHEAFGQYTSFELVELWIWQTWIAFLAFQA